MSRTPTLVSSLVQFDITLSFREEQKQYVGELVKWLVSEEVFDFQYHHDHHGDGTQNGGKLELNITSSWIYNLDILNKKLLELFPIDKDEQHPA